MPRFKIIATILLCTLLLSGCDTVRKSFGKPVSEEIEAMREELHEREEAKQKHIADSIAAAQAEALRLEEEKAEAEGRLTKQYYVVMGSFKLTSSADRLAERLQEAGYATRMAKFRSGYNVLLAGGENDKDSIESTLRQIKKLPYCPTGIWIYDISQKSHIEQ